MRTSLIVFGVVAFFSVNITSAQNLDFGEAWWTAIDRDGVQRLNVRCGPNFLDPSKIVLRSDIPVELNVNSIGGAPAQNFIANIPGNVPINVNTLVEATPAKFAFKPNAIGSYAISCSDVGNNSGSQNPNLKQGLIVIVR